MNSDTGQRFGVEMRSLLGHLLASDGDVHHIGDGRRVDQESNRRFRNMIQTVRGDEPARGYSPSPDRASTHRSHVGSPSPSSPSASTHRGSKSSESSRTKWQQFLATPTGMAILAGGGGLLLILVVAAVAGVAREPERPAPPRSRVAPATTQRARAFVARPLRPIVRDDLPPVRASGVSSGLAAAAADRTPPDIEQRLRALKGIYERGLIEKGEYERRRWEMLQEV